MVLRLPCVARVTTTNSPWPRAPSRVDLASHSNCRNWIFIYFESCVFRMYQFHFFHIWGRRFSYGQNHPFALILFFIILSHFVRRFLFDIFFPLYVSCCFLITPAFRFLHQHPAKDFDLYLRFLLAKDLCFPRLPSPFLVYFGFAADFVFSVLAYFYLLSFFASF